VSTQPWNWKIPSMDLSPWPDLDAPRATPQVHAIGIYCEGNRFPPHDLWLACCLVAEDDSTWMATANYPTGDGRSTGIFGGVEAPVFPVGPTGWRQRVKLRCGLCDLVVEMRLDTAAPVLLRLALTGVRELSLNGLQIALSLSSGHFGPVT